MIANNASLIVLLFAATLFTILTVVSKRRKNLFLTFASIFFSLAIVDLFFFFLYDFKEQQAVSEYADSTDDTMPTEESASDSEAFSDSPPGPEKAPVLGPKRYKIAGNMSDPDPLLGYAPLPNNSVHESMFLGSLLVYDQVRYEFDEKRRRVSPPVDSAPKRHAIFFGGSYVFGDGLTTEETFPAQFQALSDSQYQSYNYAFKGWGTSQMFCRLTLSEEFDDVSQPEGIAVYGFVSDHIYRTTGKPRYLEKSPTYPLFRLDGDDSLEGPFHYADRTTYKLYMDAYKAGRSSSPFLRQVLGRDAIRFMSDEKAVRVTAAVIIASKAKYEALFEGEFYVLIWPRRRLEPRLESLFVSILKKNGVKVLQVPPMDDELLAVVGVHDGKIVDGHPSARETEWIAGQLIRRLTSGEAVVEPEYDDTYELPDTVGNNVDDAVRIVIDEASEALRKNVLGVEYGAVLEAICLSRHRLSSLVVTLNGEPCAFELIESPELKEQYPQYSIRARMKISIPVFEDQTKGELVFVAEGRRVLAYPIEIHETGEAPSSAIP